jgi:hypothetical protein
LSLTQQHHFRTNASALHFESDAILGFRAGLSGPFLCLGWEDVRERAKGAISLQDSQSLRRDFVGQSFGQKLSLFGRSAVLDGGWRADELEKIGRITGVQGSVELAKRPDRKTTRLRPLPSKPNDNSND